MEEKEILKNSEAGGYYHVYNRGNRKQEIFSEKKDYLGYLERLRKYKDRHNISVICYCLMPNHIHLLLRQDADFPIYKFIHGLHTSYSMYYNRKYGKIGHLFQGRFKQKEVDKDDYLMRLSAYIHINPVAGGLVDKIEDYQWSSYLDYIGLRPGTLCDKKIVLSSIPIEDYKRITEGEIRERLIIKDMLFEDGPQT